MNIPQEPEALRQYISSLAAAISFDSADKADTIKYTPRPTDITASSKEEMLASRKGKGTRIIRVDSDEMYYFTGGSFRDEANYLLLGQLVRVSDIDI